MAKKRIIKTVTTTTTSNDDLKKKKKRTAKKKLTKTQIDEKLAENFVNLQRVLTNMTIKFDMLSINISKLLELFEISAKTFIKRYDSKESTEDEALLGKLDTLIDQNQTLAKGLTLLEEKMKHKLEDEREHEEKIHGLFPTTEVGERPRPRSRPLPRL